MNRPTESSTVTHGKFNRDPRKVQPLPTESSAVEPPESSAVSHGSTFRVGCFSERLKTFQGVLQFDYQRDTQLVGGSRRSLASGGVALADQEMKTSKGLRL